MRRRSRSSRSAHSTPRRRGALARIFGAKAKLEVENHIAREIWAIFYITFALLTYLALGGGMGRFGEWWEASFRGLFGIGINFVPMLLLVVGVVMLAAEKIVFNFTKVFGIVLIVATSLGIIHLSAPIDAMLADATHYGGIVGFVASVLLRFAFDDLGAQIILFALFLVAVLLTFGVSFRELGQYLHAKIFGPSKQKVEAWMEGEVEVASAPRVSSRQKEETELLASPIVSEGTRDGEPRTKNQEPRTKKEEFKINRPTAIKKVSDFKPLKNRIADVEWVPPSLDLLDDSAEHAATDEEVLKAKAEVIRQKLAKFGIDVTMHDVSVGPAVMQYTLKPAEGIKLSKIKNLKNDLALALAAKSLRIEAPIPGKSLVGIEIPNDNRSIVRLKELLMSDTFAKIKGNLRLVLGRDVAGNSMIGNLVDMPHLLVAGATGAGKSVGINAFLLSLIYQNSPADLRLILVDPKRVELVSYNGIPHLLTPVINDPDKTVSALKWAVSEMTRRYIDFSKIHVRNIGEYNAKVAAGTAVTKEGVTFEKLPYIVIVIDELADLMMASGKEVEACICRLAQMARAIGIHLIVATQRPSVDVITGLIKANIPTRLSFAVTSGVDSKTILDSVGAEDLLGMGDMLFIPPGASKPVRIQGAFVATEEVRRVTNAIKLELDEEPTYDTSITDKKHDVVLPGIKSSSSASDDGTDDESILKQAVQVVVETGRASASLLQRRLSLGYARAARILDLMEERGYVGPAAGSKPREIYVTAEKLNEISETVDPEVEKTRRILDEMEREREG